MITPIQKRSDISNTLYEYSPKKRFPIEVRFHEETGEPYHFIDWTPKTKNWLAQNVGKPLIYSFKVGEKRKVGQTANGPARISAYMSSLNKTFKDPSFKPESLIRNLFKDTEKASVGIIGYEESAAKADEWESDCILYHDTIHAGYNVRNGGGGGRPADPHMKLQEKQCQQIIDMVRESYKDSTRWRTVERVQKFVKGKLKKVVQFSFSQQENR